MMRSFLDQTKPVNGRGLTPKEHARDFAERLDLTPAQAEMIAHEFRNALFSGHLAACDELEEAHGDFSALPKPLRAAGYSLERIVDVTNAIVDRLRSENKKKQRRRDIILSVRGSGSTPYWAHDETCGFCDSPATHGEYVIVSDNAAGFVRRCAAHALTDPKPRPEGFQRLPEYEPWMLRRFAEEECLPKGVDSEKILSDDPPVLT